MRLSAVARDQRGFALLAVSLVIAVMGVVVTEFAFAMRLETAMVRAYKEGILARNLAEAGVQQAIREILTDATVHGVDEDGQVIFCRTAQAGAVAQRLPSLVRSRVALGAGDFSYRITDEDGRLNINGGAQRVGRLLQAIGVDRTVRDTIVDAIEDWRDANDVHRANGAESDDHYLKLPMPYRARNGNFQDAAELLQVKGVTPELYYGAEGKSGLADFVTARGTGRVNINTAPRPVLEAAGLAEAEVNDILQGRGSTPCGSLGRFGGRGQLAVGSQTFRIESEGWLNGRPKARILAIVQKSGGRTGAPVGPSVLVYTWRVLPPRGLDQPAGTQGGTQG